MKLRSVRLFDWFAIALALGVFVASLGFTLDRSQGQKSVYIKGAYNEWMYPLDANVVVAVKGPLGITHVHIQGGSAWVSDSPCKEKICIAAGKISRTGAWIACLPNKVFIRIEGTGKEEVDDVAF